MMDALPAPISGVYYIWSLLLLPASLVLNLIAFFLILRSAGTCYKDPIVPPLLSILGISFRISIELLKIFSFIGSNLLHSVLVQIFLVHQQSIGSFLFSETLCSVIQVNQSILQDVPFTTISLQLIVTLRRLMKECILKVFQTLIKRFSLLGEECLHAFPRLLRTLLRHLPAMGCINCQQHCCEVPQASVGEHR